MRNRRDELIAKLVRMGSDEGWYPDWEGPAAEPENYTYGDFGPAGEGARFGPGDHVVMMHGSQSGVIVGEPVNSFEGLAYYVDTYDQEGPRGIELWAESLLHRPDRYDQPGESTLEDWFGITPEGEDYYRTAADMGMPGWDEILTPEFEQKRRDPAHAFIHFPDTGETTWTGPGGFHEQIENDFAMNGERMPENKLYGRYYPGRDEVYFDDARYYALPWEQQRALMEQVSKQAPR